MSKHRQKSSRPLPFFPSPPFGSYSGRRPLAGVITRNHHCIIARYHQHLQDQLDESLSPVQFMMREFPTEGVRAAVWSGSRKSREEGECPPGWWSSFGTRHNRPYIMSCCVWP